MICAMIFSVPDPKESDLWPKECLSHLLELTPSSKVFCRPSDTGIGDRIPASGKKRWRYRRRVPGREKVIATLLGGLYPAVTISEAREWARGLNEQIEAGIDPRAALREEQARNAMTVARAHELYMIAVREGRSSRAKRINKPRTVKDKEGMYKRDIAPTLGRRSIYDVTEKDLIKLVEAKGKTAKVRANRLAAELKVFFGWAACCAARCRSHIRPFLRLGDLRFPENARSRILSMEELQWFPQSLGG
jgi:hypothetical protein